MLRRYAKMLGAILMGNFLYFVVLAPRLPLNARHRRDRIDWGLVIDFWICLACYGLTIFTFRPKRK